MKILITGGSGFIARNLFENLSSLYSITSPGSSNLNLLHSSNVFTYLKNHKFNIVIHTATYDAAPKHSTKDPNKVLENNLKMFFNIVRAQNYFGKMIYFGSGAEFSRDYWQPKMKEDYLDTHIPEDQYGFSKYIMTKYTENSHKIYNLRLFGMFGKYDDWKTRFIPNVCCQAVMNLPITIEQNRYRDFLYIDDLIKIVKWFIDNKPKKQVYNVCTGQKYDYKGLAEKIIKISGKKLRLIINKRGVGQEYSGDNTRLLNEIKGFKFTPINQSIKALYDWYNSNKQIIDLDQL